MYGRSISSSKRRAYEGIELTISHFRRDFLAERYSGHVIVLEEDELGAVE